MTGHVTHLNGVRACCVIHTGAGGTVINIMFTVGPVEACICTVAHITELETAKMSEPMKKRQYLPIVI